eukprot:TRINITY_DN4791_c0_g1_i1.p1 TRINITY_DN4791_c0_g1~~TRINITY_DN4791_c0_g1_i1.p1  ORF type:complete len:1055 (+),score=256.25 TRINITY_DN4791_c0_g1_i1:217-3381(+)
MLPVVFFAFLAVTLVGARSPHIPHDKHLVSNALGSNMVLQRAPLRANLWGWSVPGDTVVLGVLDTQTGKYLVRDGVIAGKDGSWNYTLPPVEGSLKKHTIVVKGNNQWATMTNVLFGDVYTCGGQSNMAFPISFTTDGPNESEKTAHYPFVRLFKIDRHPLYMDDPVPEMHATHFNPSSWAEPSRKQSWGFSAVCFHFGRFLFEGLGGDIPVGLVDVSFASQLECYLGPEAHSHCLHLEPLPCYGNIPNTTLGNTSLVWNAFLHPLLPMRNRGHLFYKGEGELGREAYWACAVDAMVTDYRKQWHESAQEFGFYWVMLHPWAQYADIKSLPNMRLAQAGYPTWHRNTGFASAADLGDEAKGIHPENKTELGRRLSLLALALNHNQPVVYKGPNVTSYKVVSTGGSQAVVHLEISPDSIGSGLEIRKSVCPRNIPEDNCVGWQLRDGDGRWLDAEVFFVDDSNKLVGVRARVPEGTTISGVRWGYGAWPLSTLYNKEGLPTTPFVFEATLASEGVGADAAPDPDAPTPGGAASGTRCITIDGVLQPTDQLNVLTISTAAAAADCCAQCSGNPQCKSWSLLVAACYMFTTAFSPDGAARRPGAVSGYAVAVEHSSDAGDGVEPAKPHGKTGEASDYAGHSWIADNHGPLPSSAGSAQADVAEGADVHREDIIDDTPAETARPNGNSKNNADGKATEPHGPTDAPAGGDLGAADDANEDASSDSDEDDEGASNDADEAAEDAGDDPDAPDGPDAEASDGVGPSAAAVLPPPFAQCKSDFAVDFRGQSGYLVAHGPVMVPAANVSFAMWVYLHKPSELDQVVVHNGDLSRDGAGLLLQADSARIGVRSGGASSFSAVRLPTRTWCFVGATCAESGRWQVYVNGKRVAGLATAPAVEPTRRFSVAGNGVHGADSFDGALDELSVWHGPLTPQQMERYSLPGSIKGDEPDLRLYLPFNEGRGEATAPVARFSRHITLRTVGTFTWTTRACEDKSAEQAHLAATVELQVPVHYRGPRDAPATTPSLSSMSILAGAAGLLALFVVKFRRRHQFAKLRVSSNE